MAVRLSRRALQRSATVLGISLASGLALYLLARGPGAVPEPVSRANAPGVEATRTPGAATPASQPQSEGARREAREAVARPRDGRQRSSGLFPNTAFGRLLEEHWQVATTPAATREAADAAYEASMVPLRERPGEAAALLHDAYRTCSEDRYDSRFTVASTLSDLKASEAADALRDIAMEPMPPERAPDDHAGSTQLEERIIRMRAADGLAELAKLGNASAGDDLLSLAESAAGDGQTSVAIRAIKGYMAAGTPEDVGQRAETLEASVPEDLHWAITTYEPTDAEVRAAMPTADALSVNSRREDKQKVN